MKGIVLAGGSGSRLYPITMGVSKQLLPIYDKPMVYYPISVLMIAGIREIAIIASSSEIHRFKRLLGDGSDFGVSFEFIEQPQPGGIAQAFILSKDFIGVDPVTLILGDNIFYGSGFGDMLRASIMNNVGATIFAYHVSNPKEFGVVEISKDGTALSITEKPETPKSKLAVTGLYIFDNQVVETAFNLKPSQRGELEITDVNEHYLKMEKLKVQVLGRGYTWLDAGTHDALLEAGKFVQIFEQRQGLKIACLEEIGYVNGWIIAEHIEQRGQLLSNTNYGQYLLSLLDSSS